jgi:hypothetical protein
MKTTRWLVISLLTVVLIAVAWRTARTRASRRIAQRTNVSTVTR